MTENTTSQDGETGTAPATAIKSGEQHYRNFVGFEHEISMNLLVVVVTGEVLVSNPGVDAVLRYAEPQGTNPKILLLDLDLIQRPGVWPQQMTWTRAGYAAVRMQRGTYTQAQIVNPQLGDTTIEMMNI